MKKYIKVYDDVLPTQITSMLLVRGKRVVEVPLIWPLGPFMIKVWNSKNILRKIFYKNSTEFDQLKKSFNL